MPSQRPDISLSPLQSYAAEEAGGIPRQDQRRGSPSRNIVYPASGAASPDVWMTVAHIAMVPGTVCSPRLILHACQWIDQDDANGASGGFGILTFMIRCGHCSDRVPRSTLRFRRYSGVSVDCRRRRMVVRGKIGAVSEA